MPNVVAAAGFVLCTQAGSNTPVAMFGLVLAVAGVITGLAMFWALPTSILGGNAAAAGIALINCTGNLGGFFSPTFIGFLKTYTGTLNSGLFLVAACMLASSILIFMLAPASSPTASTHKGRDMTTGLRKGLTSYGDAGFSLFLRKAFIKAMGYSDDALERPIIGITNTFSDYNPCHGNVPDLIESVKRGVMLAGGLPMVFPTISIGESFAHPTSMFLRNLMAMDTEEMMKAQPMDSVVLIGGCDKTLPAQVMAAASADLPAVVLQTGPMVVGNHKGEVLGACTDCRRMWAQHRAGTIDLVEIETISGRLCPSVGTCSVMGTASTMACIVEALGLALPGSAAAPATLADRRRIAEASGKRAAEIAIAGTPKAQRPHHGRLHSQRYDCPAGDRRFHERAHPPHRNSRPRRRSLRPRCLRSDSAAKSPFCSTSSPPARTTWSISTTPAVCPRSCANSPRSSTSMRLNISGGTLGDAIAAAEFVPHQDVIRSFASPLKPEGAMAILHGNLAPLGAVIKHSAASAAPYAPHRPSGRLRQHRRPDESHRRP